jgi:hypothetical protein
MLSCARKSTTRAQGHGVGSVKILHLDVEVDHRALLTRHRRPNRRHVVLESWKTM